MNNYYRILKIVLGFSLTLSAIAALTISCINTLQSDRFGLVLVYVPAFLYVYLLIKSFITWLNNSEILDAYEDFIFFSIIAMLLPFGYVFFYFRQGQFDFQTGLSFFLVVIWIINAIICFLEKREKGV